MPTSLIHLATSTFDRVDTRVHEFAVRHSVTMLRVALGFVFILFGALKFFPGLSPAQAIATATMEKLTFGLVPADTALLAVAVVEVGVGIALMANRFMRLAVWFLALEMFAILSPLVLLSGTLFSGPHHLPSLIGQYILKDFILLAGVMVLFATQRGAKITPVAAHADADDELVDALVSHAAARHTNARSPRTARMPVRVRPMPYGTRGSRDVAATTAASVTPRAASGR